MDMWLFGCPSNNKCQSNRTNLAYDVGEVEKLTEEELEGVHCVSPSMNTPVFDQRGNLRLFIFLAQQWLLKYI